MCSVLHVDRGHIGVGTDFKIDGNIAGSVVGALRGHVGHVVNPVDLFLQRYGNGFLNILSIGARIVGGYLDGGRHNIGILRNGQREHAQHTHQRDENGDHR